MAKKTGPYVGVTGLRHLLEVIRALSLVPEQSKRRLMVGVLMSSKTLAGQANKWPGRYPKKEAVAGIFVNDPRALNLVHYSTDEPDTLCDQLEAVAAIAGPNLDGFQLNVAWPPISQIIEYRLRHPDHFIVLQIGGRAMSSLGNQPQQVAERVNFYEADIDAVLVDGSGGAGHPITQFDENFLRAIQQHCNTHLGLGIAGGLGPNTLHSLNALIRDFPDLSIDAEGRLRTPMPEDVLSWNYVRPYLEDAFPLLEGKELPGLRSYANTGSYGFEEHIRRYGSGDNMLRTERLAQPLALQKGDVLATGDHVLSPPRVGSDGIVFVHLSGGTDGQWIEWIELPARIPVALHTKEDDAPSEP
jgi:hypothetical protein